MIGRGGASSELALLPAGDQRRPFEHLGYGATGRHFREQSGKVLKERVDTLPDSRARG